MLQTHTLFRNTLIVNKIKNNPDIGAAGIKRLHPRDAEIQGGFRMAASTDSKTKTNKVF
jgi:hypothetical protein